MPEMNDSPQQAGLKDYARVFYRRRWVIAAFCFIATATTALTSFYGTPIFRATATIMVEGEDTNLLTEYESAATKGMSFDIYENYLETQMNLIMSRGVAGKVFDEFKLIEDPAYKTSVDPFKKFTKTIVLERLKGTRIIEMSVEHENPQLAADIANRLAEVYSQENLKRRAVSFIRNQRMAQMNAEFLRLQSRYDELSMQFGPKHPDMIALKEEIRAAAKKLQKERSSRRNPLQPEMPDVESADFVLDDLLRAVQESSVISSSRMNNVSIADRAVPPTKKSKPKTILNTLVAFAASLVGGVFLAFVIDYFDDSIRTEEDLRRYIGGVQILGMTFHEKGSRGSKGRTKLDHLMMLRPDSPQSQTYRLIRMSMLWYARENAMKDFGVSSPLPGEGKTTVTSNLAIAMSQVHDRVLLVDTDVRRGRLHDSYGVPNDLGLGHYLSDEISFDSVIKKTEVPNLSLVTCGESALDSSKILTSPRMNEFIRKAREKFDIVVYDTPPITLIADATLLLSQLHGLILTVRSGVTGSRALQRALGIIKDSKTKMIGVLLNASDSIDTRAYNKYYGKKK